MSIWWNFSLRYDCEIAINILAAHRVEIYRATQRYPQYIIVKSPCWDIKSKLLEAYWESPTPAIEGAVISIYSDLSPQTLKKWKSFLTDDLQQQKDLTVEGLHLD